MLTQVLIGPRNTYSRALHTIGGSASRYAVEQAHRWGFFEHATARPALSGTLRAASGGGLVSLVVGWS
ncbi:hypothetical protein [Amycolatopsis sp. ATCC 39116]|uniref:hypothetical protein n=1 Tax=Amycolatopsis sp. (strain ATCC 39116 / 75iv2) TaxID=385957 RepID=UPI0012F9D373|nr:hypothetical protein [Amycolatopsis sp. ATCC 39116]